MDKNILNAVPAPEGENSPAQAEVAADPPIIILPAAGGGSPTRGDEGAPKFLPPSNDRRYFRFLTKTPQVVL